MRWTMVGTGLLGLALLAGCGSRDIANTVTVKGSDTMVILGQRWAEVYMKEHPGIIIQITGGGSGTGIAALINGGTDICQASRPMTAEEYELVKARRGVEVKEVAVALDGVVVYVHEQNPLRQLTMEQLKQIYQGDITSWEVLGGASARIVVYGRDNSSGTYAYFKDHVLQTEDFADEVQSLPGTAAVVHAVGKDLRAIGYGGIAYSTGVRMVKISKGPGQPAVEPTLRSVVSGRYPISRKLFFYTAGEPKEQTAKFIAWALSGEGQAICKEVGYFPLGKP